MQARRQEQEDILHERIEKKPDEFFMELVEELMQLRKEMREINAERERVGLV